MLEKFTDRARKVMALANQEAQRFNNDVIDTEHILLGLVKEGYGVGATVLKNFDVDIKRLRREVEKHVKKRPETVTMDKLPYTPLAKKVIEYAIEETRALNHNYVGTEHILLGLLRETEGLAAQVLLNMGLKLEDVRLEVLSLLGVVDTRSLESTTPLTLLIDPGDATSEEISELFLELSTLYRMVGGSGINFTIVDAKEPAIA
jgi:ATP-dependent Clp protease ATP-binding subunit ClpC